MSQNAVRQDLLWAVILGVLVLILSLTWHWSLVQQGFKGKLLTRLQEMEEQEAARRLEGVMTLNLEQTYGLHQEGKALFVDARSPREFQELHIEGAVNLIAEQLAGKTLPAFLQDIAPDRLIVVYCGTVDCHASLKVAELLQGRGFTRVAVFMGGFRVWDEAGYPVDITP